MFKTPNLALLSLIVASILMGCASGKTNKSNKQAADSFSALKTVANSEPSKFSECGIVAIDAPARVLLAEYRTDIWTQCKEINDILEAAADVYVFVDTVRDQKSQGKSAAEAVTYAENGILSQENGEAKLAQINRVLDESSSARTKIDGYLKNVLPKVPGLVQEIVTNGQAELKNLGPADLGKANKVKGLIKDAKTAGDEIKLVNQAVRTLNDNADDIKAVVADKKAGKI
jgi:hypothetical protein